jgi:hypothetical protein
MDTMPPSSHDAAPLEPCPRVPPAGAGRKPINSTRGKGLRQPGIRPLHNLDKVCILSPSFSFVSGGGFPYQRLTADAASLLAWDLLGVR